MHWYWSNYLNLNLFSIALYRAGSETEFEEAASENGQVESSTVSSEPGEAIASEQSKFFLPQLEVLSRYRESSAALAASIAEGDQESAFGSNGLAAAPLENQASSHNLDEDVSLGSSIGSAASIAQELPPLVLRRFVIALMLAVIIFNIILLIKVFRIARARKLFQPLPLA